MTQITEPDFTQLKKLWTLKQVVELGSLKRAADRSKVSVSAISQSLTGLEKTLGRKLLVRQDKNLVPSQYCLELLNQVEPVFQIFSNLEQASMCALKAPQMTWLDFGVSECLAGSLLPELTKSLRLKLPKLKLTLRVGKCDSLIKSVREDKLCMAVITEQETPKGVSSFELFSERLGLYCSNEFSEKEGRDLDVAVLIPGLNGHPYYYSKFLKAISLSLRPALTSDNLESLYMIAASGTMAAVLPERYAMRNPSVLREIRLPVHEKSPTLGQYKVSMISQKNCDPAEDEFLLSEIKNIFT